MSKKRITEPIEEGDLYHLSAFVAEALKDYGAIRYLDAENNAHVLLVVDETEFEAGGFHNDRLVRINLEFVDVVKRDLG